MPLTDSEQQRNERAQLGLAIGRRADEVYQRTIALLYRKGHGGAVTDAYLDYRWGRSVVGTLLITRWLVSGIAADKDEIEWISKSGSAAAREGVPLVETTPGCSSANLRGVPASQRQDLSGLRRQWPIDRHGAPLSAA